MRAGARGEGRGARGDLAIGPTFGDGLRDGAAALGAAGVENARLDAEVLLARAAAVERAGLFARLRDPLPEDTAADFQRLLARRLRREPLAYVVGEKEFYSLAFRVTPDVLIPRPETEMLVDEVLRRAPTGARVLDVGTGSGCIAIALAAQRPDLRLTACDVSGAALAVAAGNAARHGVAARIDFAASDLFAAFDAADRWDVVVSNPPYVAEAETLAPELAWEPSGALRAGDDGMAVIRALTAAAPSRLADEGWLCVEIGADQGDAARAAALDAGLAEVDVLRDLADLPRVLIATVKS